MFANRREAMHERLHVKVKVAPNSTSHLSALLHTLSLFCLREQGSKLKKMSGRKFATSCENLVATLKMLVAKLIESI